MVFICPVCEAENRANANYCRRCGQSRDYLEELAAAGARLVKDGEQENQKPFCPCCDAPLRCTDKFCYLCGELQPNHTPAFLKDCLECHTILPDKANYCYTCGAAISFTFPGKIRVPIELFRDEKSELFPKFEA